MKKIGLMLLAALLLAGCGQVEAAETVADVWEEPVAVAAPREVRLELPGEAVACAMESDTGRLYFGDGYEVMVQALTGGDLDSTIRELTGFDREDITLIQTRAEAPQRWEFAWAAAGEAGERVGRGVVLDDGNYHYCLTVLQDADDDDCQIIWSEVFNTFQLS